MPGFGTHINLLSWQCGIRAAVGITPFAILAMLCAKTLVAWAMLTLAFPRTYLTPRLAFVRCVAAAVLLCGGMIVLDVWGADTFAYAERASFIDMAGSVGLFDFDRFGAGVAGDAPRPSSDAATCRSGRELTTLSLAR